MHDGTVHNIGGDQLDGKSLAVIELFKKDRGESKWPRMTRLRTFILTDTENLTNGKQCKKGKIESKTIKRGNLVSFDIEKRKLDVEIYYAKELYFEKRWQWDHFIGGYANKVYVVLVLGTVLLWGLGYIFHNILLPLFSVDTLSIAYPVHWSIFVMEFLFAGMLTLIVGLWTGHRTFKRGWKIGFFLSLFISATAFLYLHAIDIAPNFWVLVALVISFAIRFSLTAGVIGEILGGESGIDEGKGAEHDCGER